MCGPWRSHDLATNLTFLKQKTANNFVINCTAKGREGKGKERKAKESKGKERKGKESKKRKGKIGKERKGKAKERKGKKRKEKKRKEKNSFIFLMPSKIKHGWSCLLFRNFY